MSAWDEKAQAVATALYPEDSESHRLRRTGAYAGFMHGVDSALTWAEDQRDRPRVNFDQVQAMVQGADHLREALRSDEVVERAAWGIHEFHDRGDWEHEPAEVLDEYLNMARAALMAALGEGGADE